MSGALVRCSHCEHLLPAQPGNGWATQACGACGERQEALVFPAAAGLRFPRPRPAEAAEGAARCFFHPEKGAASPCDLCGRFLCELCDLSFEGGRYCAACLASAQAGDADAPGKAVALLRDRAFVPQNLALFLSFYMPMSLVGLYFIPLTAPGAIYVSARYWNHEDGVQERGRWPFAICILLSLAELAVFAFFAWAFTVAVRKA